MNSTVIDVLDFVKENDVKFIRLAFCDLFGMQKNISIMPNELESAFKHGVSFDAHAVCGFQDTEKSDLLLFPDPATLTLLPWRPEPGKVVRFYCDIRKPDGTPFLSDGRTILKQVIERCQKMGYVCKIGAECEFYLFKTDEDGNPTSTTLDNGGYLDISPLDKGENMRREICLCLDEMGIHPETSHHEQGPGQNEIDFRFSDALSCADNFLTFKSVVKAIAARNGLFASFMPKPIMHSAGSGMHINISLSKNGINIFKNAGEEINPVANSFMAGVLSKTPEITAFLNPLANSYERFGYFEAPKYVSWSHQNRSQLIRIPASIAEKGRMELRSPDPSLNPYLSFALILAAGLDGIENNLPLPAAINENLFTAPEDITFSLTMLPTNLSKAVALCQNSAFVKSVLGQELLAKYARLKQQEAEDYLAAPDKVLFDRQRYFNKI